MKNAFPGASGTRQSPAGGIAALEPSHVLLVDDEEGVRAVTSVLLRRRGFVVTEAADGSEALQHFVNAPDRFAVLLVDLSMPGMDGATFVTAVRRLRPTQVVIAMTGHDRREAARVLSGVPVNGFLQKPFTPDSLLSMIAETTTEQSAGG